MSRGPKNSFCDLSAEQVRALFCYNLKTGLLTRKISTSNNVRVGDVIRSVGRLGYIRVSIGNKRYLAHRVIWLWMTGTWPKYEIDHRNRKPADNRWSNLREATPSENHRNRGRNANNKSGYKGVYWCTADQRFHAAIKIHGVMHRRYGFTSAKVAYKAYSEMAKTLHGSFRKV